MKNISTRIFFIFSALLLLLGVFLYNQQAIPFVYFDEVGKTDIDPSLIIKHNKSREYAPNHLHKLDSVVSNANLTLSSRVKIYDYKKYFYEVIVKDYETAHRYSDSALVLVQDQDLKSIKMIMQWHILVKGMFTIVKISSMKLSTFIIKQDSLV